MRLISSSRMTSAAAIGTELGDQGAGRRIDHLEADDFRRLQVGASLDARELRVADRREDHAEEGLADTRHAAQEQVAGVDLPLLALVVGRRNFGKQDDVGQRFRGVVPDERLAAFRDDGVVKIDRFLEVCMHGGQSYCIRPIPAQLVYRPRHARTDDGLSAVDSRHREARRDPLR